MSDAIELLDFILDRWEVDSDEEFDAWNKAAAMIAAKKGEAPRSYGYPVHLREPNREDYPDDSKGAERFQSAKLFFMCCIEMRERGLPEWQVFNFVRSFSKGGFKLSEEGTA